mgnify:CR=1 FL=1
MNNRPSVKKTNIRLSFNIELQLNTFKNALYVFNKGELTDSISKVYLGVLINELQSLYDQMVD